MKTNFLLLTYFILTELTYAQMLSQLTVQQPSLWFVQHTSFHSNSLSFKNYELFIHKSKSWNNYENLFLQRLNNKNYVFLHNHSSFSFYGKNCMSGSMDNSWQKWFFQISYEQYYMGAMSDDLLTFILSGNKNHVGKELYSTNDRFKAVELLKFSTGLTYTNTKKTRSINVAPFLCFSNHMFQLSLKQFRFYTAADTQYVLLNIIGHLSYSNPTIARFGKGFGFDFTYIDQNLLPDIEIMLTARNVGFSLQRLVNIQTNTTNDLLLTGLDVSSVSDNEAITAYIDSLAQKLNFRQDTLLLQMMLPASIQLTLSPAIHNGIAAATSFRIMPFEPLHHEFIFMPFYSLKHTQVGIPLAYQCTKNFAAGLHLHKKTGHFMLTWNTSISFASSMQYLTGMSFQLHIALTL